ncbi:hypothetical protein ACFFRE_06590 [Aciditerrimonas ferrireducens]|uniref:Uncharacterized protein n=1 Tax=Aciditerrimonas ferrireducens TaxID=667306 RepID=A0ABV6C4B1_9ACTN
MDDVTIASAGVGAVLIASAWQWRRAVHRRLRADVDAGLASADPRARLEAVTLARQLGDDAVLGRLAVALRSETDHEVARALLDALALHRWSPAGASALAELVAGGAAVARGPGFLDGVRREVLVPSGADERSRGRVIVLDAGSAVGQVVTAALARLGLEVRGVSFEAFDAAGVRALGVRRPRSDGRGPAGLWLLAPTGRSVVQAMDRSRELRSLGIAAVLPERLGAASSSADLPVAGEGPLVRGEVLDRGWDRSRVDRLAVAPKERLPCVVEAVVGDRGLLGAATIAFVPERPTGPSGAAVHPLRAVVLESPEAVTVLDACVQGRGYRGPIHALAWVGGGRPVRLVALAAGFSPALEAAERAGAGLVGTWCRAVVGADHRAPNAVLAPTIVVGRPPAKRVSRPLASVGSLAGAPRWRVVSGPGDGLGSIGRTSVDG